MTIHSDFIVDTTLRLCVEHGWWGLSYEDIALASGLSKTELQGIFPTKNSILEHFFVRLEVDSLAIVEDMEGDSAHDKLFAVMMERLDLASSFRPALQRIMDEGVPRFVLCHNQKWLHQLPQAIGGRSAWQNQVQSLALGVIWAMVLPVWFDDETTDLSPTMAILDTQLRHASQLWNFLRGYTQPKNSL